ncbi:MAG TPA: thioredoxin family protein [Phycisphaerales bacterium]|nr:thioredoxin family protein [Phycisphaerales bacterium]
MRKMILTIAAILAVSSAVLSAGESGKPSVGAGAVKSKAGKKAPEFKLKNYDGKMVSLSDYKGKIVVLEWYNYECPFVKHHYEKLNTMVNLADKYKAKNVVWLAINSTSHLTTEKNKEFAEEHKVSYPMLDDRSGKVGRAYKARTTPHIFIINTEGMIVFDGAIDNSPLGRRKKGVINYVDKALGELTSGKKISISRTKPYGCTVKYAN